ncbi:unnamed protein product [Orchesella dallaii]|uniref:Cytochrome P450 n=1 Tax=Orchesella dallaii TaxID=48710 RepID=A0ABP1PQJ6_9HEXA
MAPTKNYLLPFLDYSIVLVLSTFFLILYKLKIGINKRRAFVNQFPGPNLLPIIGNGHQMIFKPTDFYKWSSDMCKRWGDPMRLWCFDLPVFLISSFETASQLLSNPNFVAKSKDIDMFWRQEGGNGISSSPAHIHQSRKKLLLPGYSRQIVERSVDIFTEESKNLVKKLEAYAKSGSSFEGVCVLMPSSFRIICRSAFGDSLMSERNDTEALEQMHSLHTISINFANRIMSPFLWIKNDFIYFNLTKEGSYTTKCKNIINSFGTEAINRRRREILENKNNHESNHGAKELNHNETEENVLRLPPPCYLDMLLEIHEKGGLKDSEILGELNNYIAAGYDTTALAVAWALFALALNPMHQEKIFKEVDEIIGPGTPLSDAVITAADTKQMKYLELCIKESMRMFPTSPVLPRSTTDNMPLKDGRVIPAGSDVLIMVHLMHKDPKYFPNPEEFMPERHLKPIPAFIPFSVGGRNCIGQMYAMYQIKVELACLIREFVWETSDKPETLPCLFQGLLAPAKGIQFRIKRRLSCKSG